MSSTAGKLHRQAFALNAPKQVIDVLRDVKDGDGEKQANKEFPKLFQNNKYDLKSLIKSYGKQLKKEDLSETEAFGKIPAILKIIAETPDEGASEIAGLLKPFAIYLQDKPEAVAQLSAAQNSESIKIIKKTARLEKAIYFTATDFITKILNGIKDAIILGAKLVKDTIVFGAKLVKQAAKFIADLCVFVGLLLVAPITLALKKSATGFAQGLKDGTNKTREYYNNHFRRPKIQAAVEEEEEEEEELGSSGLSLATETEELSSKGSATPTQGDPALTNEQIRQDNDKRAKATLNDALPTLEKIEGKPPADE